MIDAGFLELVRLGELPATDADGRSRCPSSTRPSRADTASGAGWHRYNGDGYGDARERRTPVGAERRQGTGHVVAGARRPSAASRQLQTGGPSSAAAFSPAMASFASGVGLIPEQDWELARPGARRRSAPTRRWRRSAS